MVVLLGRRNENGVWNFLVQDPDWVGVPIQIPISEDLPVYIKSCLRDAVGGSVSDFNLVYRADSMLIGPRNQAGVLVVAESASVNLSGASWLPLPEILRSGMARGNKLTYMKVMQFLSGVADQEIDAAEFSWDDIKNSVLDV